MLLTTSSSRLLTPIKMAFSARFKEVKKRTGCKSDNFYFSDLFPIANIVPSEYFI